MQSYCVKCKAQTDSNDAAPVVMKNGRDAISSICGVCGTKKFKIGKMPVEA